MLILAQRPSCPRTAGRGWGMRFFYSSRFSVGHVNGIYHCLSGRVLLDFDRSIGPVFGGISTCQPAGCQHPTAPQKNARCVRKQHPAGCLSWTWGSFFNGKASLFVGPRFLDFFGHSPDFSASVVLLARITNPHYHRWAVRRCIL